jgi:hypothetical protein
MSVKVVPGIEAWPAGRHGTWIDKQRRQIPGKFGGKSIKNLVSSCQQHRATANSNGDDILAISNTKGGLNSAGAAEEKVTYLFLRVPAMSLFGMVEGGPWRI